MRHKPAGIKNLAGLNCDTIYITIYNDAELFSKFQYNVWLQHNFHKLISDLNSSQFNCTGGLDPKHRYGIINYSKKEGTIIIIIDIDRTMTYDSRVALLDIEALSIKGKPKN